MDGLKGPRSEDRLTQPARRSWSFGIVLTVLVLASIGAVSAFQSTALLEATGLWRRQALDIPELGIQNLPADVAESSEIGPWLARMTQEPCDQEAVNPLAAGMRKSGQPRLAAEVLSSFYNRCKGSPQFLDDALEIFMGIGEFDRAYELGNALVQADPAYGRYRYLRGWSAEKLGRHQQSLVDYTNALNLLGDPRHVAGSEFYNVAQAHARLGQFCEAITPIQQWMSYDADRDTPQTRTIIQEFAEQGKCGAEYAVARKAFTLPVTGDVLMASVTVNGKPGKFIIDTGASLVSLTAAFAEAAGIPIDSANEIIAFTANGSTTAILSHAENVAIGPLNARDVTVSVARQNREFGPGIDGLLGMSFLARFNVSLTPSSFEISAIR